MSLMAYESTPGISYLLKLDTLILNLPPNQNIYVTAWMLMALPRLRSGRVESAKCCPRRFPTHTQQGGDPGQYKTQLSFPPPEVTCSRAKKHQIPTKHCSCRDHTLTPQTRKVLELLGVFSHHTKSACPSSRSTPSQNQLFPCLLQHCEFSSTWYRGQRSP